MYKLLFDSDSLIKMVKTPLLEAIVDEFETCITEEVYEEAVEEGKKRLYFDAEVIEGYVEKELLKVVDTSEVDTEDGFGKGEMSLLEARDKKTILVSDDLEFVKHCQNKNITVASSIHFIPFLLKNRIIPETVAKHSVKNIKKFVRDETYQKAKKEVEKVIQ